jgi:L-malate glycosyltransferase
MRVLWITNIQLPATCEYLGQPSPVFGGWLSSLVNELKKESEIELAVATVYKGKEFKNMDIDNVKYYLLPIKKIRIEYNSSLDQYWMRVQEEYKPDIVHIHGTELAHGLACMRVCSSLKYIISIQGLVEIYSRYYYGDIRKFDLLKCLTFRDLFRLDTIFHGRIKFQNQGLFEKEYFKRTCHVIGRTSWDYAHAKFFNPSVTYHFCNETLREKFYTAPKWNINRKTDYTIFLSQATYPIKGLHQVLKAVAFLKREFKNINVRIAGPNITDTGSFNAKVRINGYGLYIKRLISKLKIHEQVQFLGILSEEKMISEYLNAHVFICPSSIENSPNSVGEAQLLGVPCIASYVGGVPDMITHGKSGLLYRFEEVEMLAKCVTNIFLDHSLSKEISINGIVEAEKRHSYSENLKQILCIYKEINSVN